MRVVRLPGAEIASKDAFLDAVGDALGFPDYFGRNWDALDECLGEIDEPTVVEWDNSQALAAADHAAYEMALGCFADSSAPVELRLI